MSMPRDNLARVWCGKRTYPDYPSAVRAARGINDRSGGNATAYYCTTCQSFHFGRKGTRAKPDVDQSSLGENDVLTTIEKHKSAAPSKVAEIVRSTITPDRELSWLAQRVAKGREAPFCEIAAITPAIATHLLERNDDNRPISEKQVAHICTDIARGYWELNGESIIVAKDGCLNDGQNRLTAIVRSGETIQSVIVFGVSRRSRLTVDMGRQRSASQFLGMQHVKNASHAAGVAQLVDAYFKGHYAANGNNRISKQEILAVYDKRNKVIDAATSLVMNDKFAKSTASTALATAYVIIIGKYPTTGVEFFEKLFTGENLKRGDPILYCRAHLIESGSKRLRTWEKLEAVLRYWVAWREGKKLAQRVRLQGSHPKYENL